MHRQAHTRFTTFSERVNPVCGNLITDIRPIHNILSLSLSDPTHTHTHTLVEICEHPQLIQLFGCLAYREGSPWKWLQTNGAADCPLPLPRWLHTHPLPALIRIFVICCYRLLNNFIYEQNVNSRCPALLRGPYSGCCNKNNIIPCIRGHTGSALLQRWPREPIGFS